MNPSNRIRVESLVVQDKGAPAIVSTAIFEGVESGEDVVVLLDKGVPERRRKLAHYRLAAQALVKTSELQCEVRYKNIGAPIPVWDYLDLPDERRGFELLD